MSTSNIILKIEGDALEFLLEMERLRASAGATAEEVLEATAALAGMDAPIRADFPTYIDYEAAVLRWFSGRTSYRDGDLELGRARGFARLSWTRQAWHGVHGDRVPWEPKVRSRRR